MKFIPVVKHPVGRSQRLIGLGASLALGLALTGCGGGGGGSPPAPRFSLVQTCVQDASSGLTWQKLPGLSKAFADLSTYVADQNSAKTCGVTDWRLPSVNELLSLMNASVPTGNPPNADVTVSGDSMMNKFWTSEISATASADAWLVDTVNGATVDVAIKTTELSVRLVRGSASTPTACTDDRFSAPAAGIVSDRVTKLMWKKCPEGFTDSACTAGPALSYTDQTSISERVRVNNTNSVSGLGFSDWRVPTKNELASLVNRTCSNPALLATVFPNIGLLNFVTATVDADAAARVWSVNFDEGSIGPLPLGGPSSAQFSLRLVRTGP